jgi:hypothetical protein
MTCVSFGLGIILITPFLVDCIHLIIDMATDGTVNYKWGWRRERYWKLNGSIFIIGSVFIYWGNAIAVGIHWIVVNTPGFIWHAIHHGLTGS